MGRRSLKHCTFCGPDLIAVGKYYLRKEAHCESGWMAVCEDCATSFKRFHEIQYYSPRDVVTSDCQHTWNKKSLVTQPGGFDEMICDKCGQIGRRYGLGAPVQPV